MGNRTGKDEDEIYSNIFVDTCGQVERLADNEAGNENNVKERQRQKENRPRTRSIPKTL